MVGVTLSFFSPVFSDVFSHSNPTLGRVQRRFSRRALVCRATGPEAPSKRLTRARNVSLSGPASRAACITFDRPKAKSNCADESASTTGTSSPSCRRCSAATSFREPSAAASDALISAGDPVAHERSLGLGKAGGDQSGLVRHGERIESARSLSRSVRVNQIRQSSHFALEPACENPRV